MVFAEDSHEAGAVIPGRVHNGDSMVIYLVSSAYPICWIETACSAIPGT